MTTVKGTIMATQSKSNPVVDSVEAATERFADLNEKAVASSKKASEVYLASYEKTVVALADTYEKATGATKIEWVASLGSLQADATREITRAYTNSVREFVS
jgi:hypothetical protein